MILLSIALRLIFGMSVRGLAFVLYWAGLAVVVGLGGVVIVRRLIAYTRDPTLR